MNASPQASCVCNIQPVLTKTATISGMTMIDGDVVDVVFVIREGHTTDPEAVRKCVRVTIDVRSLMDSDYPGNIQL